MSGTLSNLKGLLGEQRNPKEPKGTIKNMRNLKELLEIQGTKRNLKKQ